MHKHVNNKPIKKVRRIDSSRVPELKNKRAVHKDVDDFIYGDKSISPSNR